MPLVKEDLENLDILKLGHGFNFKKKKNELTTWSEGSEIKFYFTLLNTSNATDLVIMAMISPED